MTWLEAPPDLSLPPGEVHVWRASLELEASTVEALARELAPDELEAASRKAFERDRVEVIASRAFLRRLIARYEPGAPAPLRFAKNPHGKPALPSRDGRPSLRFNLSHSRGLALLAFARDLEVGVDVERIEPARAEDGLAERTMTARELGCWRALPPPQRAAAFFRLWTAKEACIKAAGLGLSLDPREFHVAPDGFAPFLERVDLHGSTFTLLPLDPGHPWAAALAAPGPIRQVHCWILS